MPRFARLHAPGAVHHIVARFVDRAFRIDGPEARREYLRRLARSLARCDWSVLAYALMSNHVHLVARAGADPSARFIHPLHTGYALWLNRRDGRLGPAFAERHTTVLADRPETARLVAYVHNNPVRAGLVAWAGDSEWTSHRAYLGLEAAPPWLSVAEGLALMGCDGDTGRADFDALVRQRAGDARDPFLSEEPTRERQRARQATGTPVEVSWPAILDGQRQVTVLTPSPSLPVRFPGEPATVIELAQRAIVGAHGPPPRRHSRNAARLRRLALLVWVDYLGCRQVDMARALGTSNSAASHLRLRRGAEYAELRVDAEIIAGACWERVAAGEPGTWQCRQR